MSDKGFSPVEHTADIGLRLWGKAAEDLFCSAFKGLLYLADRGEGISSDTETRHIKIDSPDMESLLVDFLNELLYMINNGNWIPAEIDGICISGTGLECSIRGGSCDPANGKGREIKAATYHNLEISKNDDTMTTIVYFDT